MKIGKGDDGENNTEALRRREIKEAYVPSEGKMALESGGWDLQGEKEFVKGSTACKEWA